MNVFAKATFFMVGDNIYEPLEEKAKEMYKETAEAMTSHRLELKRGKIEITDYGRLLITACIS